MTNGGCDTIFAAYSPIIVRSLALILKYLPRLLRPSLLLTPYTQDNSPFTESMVDFDMLHSKAPGLV